MVRVQASTLSVTKRQCDRDLETENTDGGCAENLY
jgi:hypothetical protein